MTKLLKFSAGNDKLSKRILTFSLPAGHTCPLAGICHSKVDRESGKLILFGTELNSILCFATQAERQYPATRNARWYNFDLLQAADSKADLIYNSLVYQDYEWYPYVRIHVSGDFYSLDYLRAWLEVARRLPQTVFYAYTKSLSLWRAAHSEIPSNFYLTASVGGKQDDLIWKHPEIFYRYAQVVYSEEEAAELGLEIDHDDSHCWEDKPFALLIHNHQIKGTKAYEAVTSMRKRGIYSGYTHRNRVLAPSKS